MTYPVAHIHWASALPHLKDKHITLKGVIHQPETEAAAIVADLHLLLAFH